MTLTLQILLIVFCLGVLITIVKQISSSRVIFSDFNYWLIFILALLFLAIFPKTADFVARLLGIQTVVFAVFLVVTFLLILLALSAFFRISVLNRRFIQLTQKIALMEEELEKRVERLETQEQEPKKKSNKTKGAQK